MFGDHAGQHLRAGVVLRYELGADTIRLTADLDIAVSDSACKTLATTTAVVLHLQDAPPLVTLLPAHWCHTRAVDGLHAANNNHAAPEGATRSGRPDANTADPAAACTPRYSDKGNSSVRVCRHRVAMTVPRAAYTLWQPATYTTARPLPAALYNVSVTVVPLPVEGSALPGSSAGAHPPGETFVLPLAPQAYAHVQQAIRNYILIAVPL